MEIILCKFINSIKFEESVKLREMENSSPVSTTTENLHQVSSRIQIKNKYIQIEYKQILRCIQIYKYVKI